MTTHTQPVSVDPTSEVVTSGRSGRRGRPPKPKGEKYERATYAMPPEMVEMIENAARKLGVPASEIVRRAIAKFAEDQG